MCVRKYSHVINQALRGICTCRITIRPHLGHLAVNTVATSHSRLVFAVPNSHDLMGHAERLHQNRSREGQEAHAPFYVQYEVIEKTFQQSQHADASVFTDMIKGEIEKVNSHVVACLGVLESASPASDTELVRCSAECGSLVAFIHCNGKGLREIVKKFEEEEKMRSTTWECCTRVSMRMIETAPFCTSLLERLLNVQAGLEESVHGSLRRLLTEAYEASAGLSDNESPSVRGPPIAPDAPRLRAELFEASAGLSQNESQNEGAWPARSKTPAALRMPSLPSLLARSSRCTPVRPARAGLSLTNYAPPGLAQCPSWPGHLSTALAFCLTAPPARPRAAGHRLPPGGDSATPCRGHRQFRPL